MLLSDWEIKPMVLSYLGSIEMSFSGFVVDTNKKPLGGMAFDLSS